jgi:hypothetical protein
LAITVPVGQQLKQRFAFDLGHRIPDGHVDGANRHRTLTMAPWLFVGEHGLPDFVRAQVVACFVQQRGGVGLKDARDEPLAHQRALAIATIGVEAVANHRFAIADHIGDHRHQAEVHFAKVDVSVPDRGTDGKGSFADFNNFHVMTRVGIEDGGDVAATESGKPMLVLAGSMHWTNRT